MEELAVVRFGHVCNVLSSNPFPIEKSKFLSFTDTEGSKSVPKTSGADAAFAWLALRVAFFGDAFAGLFETFLGLAFFGLVRGL